MKLIPVDAIPKVSGYHKLQELIEEFVNGDAKIVKVDFTEDDYKSPAVCRSCLAAAIKRSKRSVKVQQVYKEVNQRESYCKHDNTSHHSRRITSIDRGDDIAPQSRPGKHGLS